MGGGDLNMKKSWHTKTRANMLRVAEEKRKAEEEARRIANIQKELHEERQREELDVLNATVTKKSINKLDWMYNTPASHQDKPQSNEELEEYLLGKKDVNSILAQKDKEAEQPEAKWKSGLFAFSNRNANNERDTAAKAMEDPMMEIKRREQAAMLSMRRSQGQDAGADKDRDRKSKKKDRDSKSKSKSKSRHSSKEHRSKKSDRARGPQSPVA
ncbi:RNA-splicing factor [Coemansia interrupta]|uniref:RNA-splicing factor n=1 Tax=Coemansia interrupta TaxID=1126814 RepID=A0A9W8LGI4_9FUNG|nr:RNA-splicing factor [Coemansia interrupta]